MNELQEKGLFCANFKKYRKSMRLTQEGLAIRSGYSRAYISALERGRINPTLQTIILLSRGLGVEPYILLMNYDNRKCNSMAQ